MNAAEMNTRMLSSRADIDAAFEEYRAAILEHAEAKRIANLAEANSYVTIKARLDGRPPVAEIEAHVTKATSRETFELDLAAGRLKAAHLNVQYRLGVLSSLQSLASLTKAEAQIAAYEPREVSA